MSPDLDTSMPYVPWAGAPFEYLVISVKWGRCPSGVDFSSEGGKWKAGAWQREGSSLVCSHS